MARRRKVHATHVNHERWMVSYADFVTLLFAFFVVLFATANADKSKVAAVAESFRSAISHEAKGRSNDSGKIVVDAELSRRLEAKEKNLPPELRALMPSMKVLTNKLDTEIKKGEVELRMEPRGLIISFKQAATFDSGAAQIKNTAISSIGKVAEALDSLHNKVLLEGHTDNIPIHNGQFRNNWSLSAARGAAILDILVDRFHVPAKRLGVGGYADVAPIADNSSEDGRAKNRRVDVVILSDIAASRMGHDSLLSTQQR